MFVNTPQQLAEKKLLLLYILNEIEGALTNSQITQFVLENDMMNYFMLQQFLAELKESGFVHEGEGGHIQLFSITEKGRNTLNYFINRIPQHQKLEINNLIAFKKESFLGGTEIKADYTQLKDATFAIKLMIIENNVPIVNLKLNVSSQQRAKEICENWRKDAVGIYGKIMEML
ncbi:DUF4364 family protein [Natronincola ferrireducens]|uniref:DUF4364 family protein n=1 Tax=Natronincola ferrireducens TaxID=393762 RepID=A0A1G8ZRH7_9FIRM|nr:DUF4364 family protein [Natronincola ferrireducens]SDK17668.1 protein of unknown function [Natronincola ferrireducens]